MRGQSPEETGVEVSLVRRSPFRRDQGVRSEGVKKRSTVGRLCDLPWVVETTYSRFFRRPTVGRFLTLPKRPLEAGSGRVSFSIAEEREKSLGVSLVAHAE